MGTASTTKSSGQGSGAIAAALDGTPKTMPPAKQPPSRDMIKFFNELVLPEEPRLNPPEKALPSENAHVCASVELSELRPDQLIEMAIQHCIKESFFAGGPLMVLRLRKMFEWGPDKTGTSHHFMRSYRFCPEAMQRQTRVTPHPDRKNDSHNHQANHRTFDYESWEDAIATKALFEAPMSDEEMRRQLKAINSHEASNALLKATWEVNSALLGTMSQFGLKEVWQRGQLSNNIQQRASRIDYSFTALHFYIQDLTHTLCIHFNLPQYRRTLWFKLLLEDPSEPNDTSQRFKYVDLYDHGQEPWSNIVKDIERHRGFPDANGKKLISSEPYSMVAYGQGGQSLKQAMEKHAEVIVSDASYATKFHLSGIRDYLDRSWGRVPVAVLWQKSTLQRLQRRRRRKGDGKEDKEKGRKSGGQDRVKKKEKGKRGKK